MMTSMTWLGNVNRYAQGNALVRKCVQKPQNPVKIVLLILVHKFVMVQLGLGGGGAIVLNRCENYVLHTTMFLEKLPFCLETAVCHA